MKIKTSLLFLTFLFSSCWAFAQFKINPEDGHYCHIDGNETTEELDLTMPTQYAADFVANIMSRTGLANNFTLVQSVDAEKAFAFIDDDGEKYIVYNEHYLQRLENDIQAKWPIIYVFAHEIGHHLNGHLMKDDNNRNKRELEADEFAGFILQSMGATLDETLAVCKTFKENATATHPGRNRRIRSATKGWNKGAKKNRAFPEGKEPCGWNTGEVVFVNNTGMKIKISCYEVGVLGHPTELTLIAGEQKGIYILASRQYRYECKSINGNKKITGGAVGVNPCRAKAVILEN